MKYLFLSLLISMTMSGCGLSASEKVHCIKIMKLHREVNAFSAKTGKTPEEILTYTRYLQLLEMENYCLSKWDKKDNYLLD